MSDEREQERAKVPPRWFIRLAWSTHRGSPIRRNRRCDPAPALRVTPGTATCPEGFFGLTFRGKCETTPHVTTLSLGPHGGLSSAPHGTAQPLALRTGTQGQQGAGRSSVAHTGGERSFQVKEIAGCRRPILGVPSGAELDPSHECQPTRGLSPLFTRSVRSLSAIATKEAPHRHAVRVIRSTSRH